MDITWINHHLSSITIIILALVCTSLFAIIGSIWMISNPTGSEKMRTISARIREGASAFLWSEYQWIALVVMTISVILGYFHYDSFPLARIGNFMLGALFSCIAGIIGMWIATLSNVRTAEGARSSLAQAFSISFIGGAIMGVSVVGLALLGLSCLLAFAISGAHVVSATGASLISTSQLKVGIDILTGFALGGETVALFARVAGGIYTKAADVGADIVGKVEAGIPEDDPRNPAVIADNVGDNVGDVAGMGADLFGSYISTLLAAIVLGTEMEEINKVSKLLLPLTIGGLGLLSSLIAIGFIWMIRRRFTVTLSLEFGNLLSIILTIVGSYLVLPILIGSGHKIAIVGTLSSVDGLFYCIMIGLGVGWIVSWTSGYFTGIGKPPVNFIVRQSITGPATNLISGLGIGMISTAIPMIIFAVAIYGAYSLGEFYGVAMAGVGLMATTTMQLAMDAFGPIADNAGGIAEMGGLDKKVRERTDILDAVGNTTAAMGKGFAIASAALTSLALFASFIHIAGIQGIDLYKAPVLGGLFIGAMIPFLFSALIITSVGKAAMQMVHEVRRQFREIPGILEGKDNPQYGQCVRIATKAALLEMILPGLIALIVPTIVGNLGGAEMLAAFLAGLVVSGTAMALLQCNAGGAWDNAKKAFEKGVTVDGKKITKGSQPHQAAVVGDTVGDPLKDASGPAINILIKLSIIVALMVV
ncbi:MAG: sodium-translocating pyrophosphatase [Bacteroidota bacterium]